MGLSVAVVFVVLGDGVSVAKRVQGTNVSCKISKSWEILFSWVCLGSGCEIFFGRFAWLECREGLANERKERFYQPLPVARSFSDRKWS